MNGVRQTETVDQGDQNIEVLGDAANADSCEGNIRRETDVSCNVPPSHQILFASAYLYDACKGNHIEFEPTVSAVHLYSKFKSTPLEVIMYCVLFVYLSLVLFEEPAVQGLELPLYITILIECLCLAFFLFRLVHEYAFTKKEIFWRDRKHIMLLLIIIISVCDIGVYLALVESGIFTIRITRALRPLIFVNIPEGRQIRLAFRNIRRTLPEIGSVLVLYFMILALFALMAFKIFGKRGWVQVTGEPYFPTYLDSYWELYVLVTTSNTPDIMMPAYNEEPWLCLFFIVFIVICLYIFMSIFLAVVYNNYRTNLKNEVYLSIHRKRELLNKVFDLMKRLESDQEKIRSDDFHRLIKNTFPRKSQQYSKVLWCVLDVDRNGWVDRQEFMCVADLLNIPVTEVLPNLLERSFPSFYCSKYSSLLKYLVKHKAFRYLFDAIIVVNAFFILFDLDGGEWGFLAIFMLEILLKIYTFGFYMFIRKMWNIFDVVVIGSAFVISLAEEIREDRFDSGLILDVMLVLRVLRILKIFQGLERFKTILNTIIHILPSMCTYAGVLFVFFYFFAIVGMEAFKTQIQYFGYNETNQTSDQLYCGSINLKDSEFYRLKYCANNFTNVLRAFVLLYELLVVNQWHVLVEGFQLATGSKLTRIYFMSFHCLSVIIILNIFTAFVLEVFILEYSFTKGDLETTLEAKVNEMGLGLGSRPVMQSARNKDGMNTSILDGDELDSVSVDADHDNLQFTVQQLEQMTQEYSREYSNYSRETSIRFHLSKGGRNVYTLLEKLFITELDLSNLDLSHSSSKEINNSGSKKLHNSGSKELNNSGSKEQTNLNSGSNSSTDETKIIERSFQCNTVMEEATLSTDTAIKIVSGTLGASSVLG